MAQTSSISRRLILRAVVTATGTADKNRPNSSRLDAPKTLSQNGMALGRDATGHSEGADRAAEKRPGMALQKGLSANCFTMTNQLAGTLGQY